jgi:uncharacterized membrane protein
MKTLEACLVVALVGLSRPASAEVTFEFILEGGYAIEISDDGQVVVGNTAASYEPFRWTAATGMVPLGRSSVEVLGVGGGTPGVSADGALVASTILSNDSTFATQGLWSEAEGWMQLMPPSPPDGGLLDRSLGSVWGMSGNGEAVVGLYWRQMAPSAKASRWTAAEGAISLGSTGRSSRANAANYDGSVIVGWDEHSTGPRRPAAWVNGTPVVILSELDGMGEAFAVNPEGSVAVGYQREWVNNMRAAALWRRTGTTWSSAQILGVLPGTAPEYGVVIGNGVTADGGIVVGFNSFAGDPFYTAGFIWTEATGMENIADFLAAHDALPPGFTIGGLEDITPDGTSIIGYGQDTAAPFTRRSFIIHLDPATSGVPVETAGAIPQLLRVRPNPTWGATTLSLDLPIATSGVLSIFDCNGRVVRRLLSGPIAAGQHEFEWDGRTEAGAAAAAGVYYSTFSGAAMRQSQKLVLLR